MCAYHTVEVTLSEIIKGHIGNTKVQKQGTLAVGICSWKASFAHLEKNPNSEVFVSS